MNNIEEKRSLRRKELDFFTSVVVDNVCRALRNGYPTAIVELKQQLLKGKITPSSVDEHGCSVMHAACQGGLLDAVIDLYQKGYLFEKDREGNTPLHVTYLFCHQKLSEWLISRGQDPDETNGDGVRAREMSKESVCKSIFLACMHNRAESVVAAVGRGWISVSDQDEGGRTLLHRAAASGHRALAAKLASLGSDVNATDAEGNLPLHLAMAGAHVDVAEFLVDRGADTERRNLQEQTPWDCFISCSAAAQPPPDGTSGSDDCAALGPGGGEAAPPGGAARADPEERLRRAAQIYCRATRRFLDPGASEEVTALRRQFDEHCALGTQGLGVENVRTGQASRDQTMDYLEFYQVPRAARAARGGVGRSGLRVWPGQRPGRRASEPLPADGASARRRPGRRPCLPSRAELRQPTRMCRDARLGSRGGPECPGPPGSKGESESEREREGMEGGSEREREGGRVSERERA